MKTSLSRTIVLMICLFIWASAQSVSAQARGGAGGGIGGGAGGGIGGAGAGGLNAGAGGLNEQIQQGAGTIDGTQGRDGRQAGAFVGADTTDAQNFRSIQTNVTQPRQPTRNANRNVQQNTGGQQQGRGANLRRRLHVGFKVPTASTTRVSQNLTGHFRRLSRTRFPGNVQVSMQGQTVVLSGSVASTDDAELAVALAKLEPGVWEVRNELKVVPVPSTDSIQPTGSFQPSGNPVLPTELPVTGVPLNDAQIEPFLSLP